MKIRIAVVIFAIALFAFTNNVKAQVKGKWIAPSSAKKITNPISAKKKSASAKKGAKIFAQFCVACHGDLGKGDGAGSKALDPKPANLTSAPVQDQVDGEIFWKISNGRNGMIRWDGIINESDRWNLVNYVRTLK